MFWLLIIFLVLLQPNWMEVADAVAECGANCVEADSGANNPNESSASSDVSVTPSEIESSVRAFSGDIPALDLSPLWKESTFLFPTTKAYALLPSENFMDPQEGESFTITVVFRFFELPPYGARQNLISKFSNTSSPFPGWAIAIQRYTTSTRPRVYWSGTDGAGGWYTFDSYDFIPKRWYAITLMFTKQHNLLIFVEDLSLLSTLRASNANINSSQLHYGVIAFAGGYRISKSTLPSTNANFLIGSFSPQWKNCFIGEILAVAFSKFDPFPGGQTWRGNLSKIRSLPLILDPKVPDRYLIASWSEASYKGNISLKGDAKWKSAR